MTNPQDFERLSAYIDGQLPAAEKSKLEARLARDPELKATLADLRSTVRLVRSLPLVKPPRNFTLSAAQAQALRRPRFAGLLPGLRLATTLAALALVVVVAGDLGSGFFLSPAASPVSELGAESAPVAMETAVVQAVESPEAATTESAFAALADVTPEATPGGSADHETDTPDVAALAVGTSPSADEGQTESATPAPEPTAEDQARAMGESTETPAAKVGGDAPGAAVTEPPAEAVAAQAPEPERALAIRPIRIVEISLAALTLILTLAVWLARRV